MAKDGPAGMRREQVGRAGPPLLCSASVRAGGPVLGPGQAERELRMSRVWISLGTRTRLLILSLAQGWCGARQGAGGSVKWGDGRGSELRAEAEGSSPRGRSPRLRIRQGRMSREAIAALSRCGRPLGWRVHSFT